MADTSAQANRLMEEGEARLTKFAPFTPTEEKCEKARDKFLSAATMFKASSAFDKAGAAFLRASDMSQKAKQEMDLADDLHNAAMCFKKAGDRRADDLLVRVCELYDKNGKYSQAAKVCVAVAELGGENSMEWFQRAIRYYKNEGSRVTANEIVFRIAQYHCSRGDFESARQIYDKQGKEALDDRLSRGTARKLLFTALLCQIAMLSPTNISEGVELLKDRFSEYQELDTQFTDQTREHMLINQLIAAIENQDVDAYGEAMDEFDQIVPLDEIKTKMLLRGKSTLRQTEAIN